ncbi:hypothetical protein K432DRAFT_403334 [Lepidopterella palustris CBS 459.81]|uniref:UBC core domain-containing protein n=1 Tax=Lepidopterella palustris CBS 459.81 TaxID=1314670 RepID=A0A8E2JGY3_9PEZI|nr:hypothetical protein K432DRAFT_403334 [Lepidopterella palustris CBS 459.81]
MAEQAVTFCVEDTCGLKDDKYMVGVVDRTFADVDSHEPLPQRDYTDDIQKHNDVPRAHYQKFLKTGVPPRGTVLVSWQTEFKTELIPESKLELLDRALFVGDVVKRNAQSPMSGTVIGTKATCTLFPATAIVGNQIPESITEDINVRGVPADELLNVHEYQEAALVAYQSWIGRIEDVYDEVTVRLSNGSVVVVENPDELDPDDPLVDRLSVGDSVKTKKGNLRRGRWKFGAFNPNEKPHGTVVETRTTNITVRWLGRKLGEGQSSSTVEPPMEIGMDLLDSGDVYVYDTTKNPAHSPGTTSNAKDKSYHIADITVGDRVRFKDLTGACVKYDGTRTLPNGLPQGKVERIPRTDTQGYDMNVFLVMQTQTYVTILWQDLSITEDNSTSLIPDPNIDDEDEVWPGEIVCTKQQANDSTDTPNWAIRPARVGVVQSVNAVDRIATVRWFENSSIRFIGEDLIQPCHTGSISSIEEDVSLYDIKSTSGLTRRRGDFVLIHPNAHMGVVTPLSDAEMSRLDRSPTWFGEVIDLGLDGLLTVRLGAADPVADVRVAPEHVLLVYSSDMDSHLDGVAPPGADDEDYDDMDEGDSGFDTESFNEMWVEYEGGRRTDTFQDDEDEWSTEDEEDDDGDISMPDLIPVDMDVDTTKTTPETQSEEEVKDITVPMGTTTAPVEISSPTDTQPQAAPNTAPKPREAPDHTTNDDALASFLVLETAPPTDTQSHLAHPNTIPKALETLDLTTGDNAPTPFLVLDTAPPADHHHLNHTLPSNPAHARRLAKEHKILRTSLPPGIFVRTWESRLDLLRVLIIGPSDTPYEFAPFVIDFHLGTSFPSSPPEAYFHSWTNGMGPVNPNLYEDGKICLSLLGTWHADERNENWSPAKSTVLQVLVSLMGLVLVKEPYYNEAGYDIHLHTPETLLPSALYTERAYFRARAFITHALTNPIEPFADELKYLYLDRSPEAPQLLAKSIKAAKEIIERSERKDDEEKYERDGLRRISLGAVMMLKRQVAKLEGLNGEDLGQIGIVDATSKACTLAL